MSLSVKVSGVWKDGSTLHAKVSGVWKSVSSGWLKVGGVWKQFYAGLSAIVTGPLSDHAIVIFPGTPVVAELTKALTITGTGPYTYLWQYTGVPSTTSSATIEDFTMQLVSSVDEFASGTVWCDVTDTFGNTVSSDVSTWALSVAT